MAKNAQLLKALNTAAHKPTPAPAAPESPADPAYYKAPSREGKLHVSAWLDPQFKKSLRAIQMAHPEKTLQDLFSEALNDMFEKYDVPVVSEDRKPAAPPLPHRASARRPQGQPR